MSLDRPTVQDPYETLPAVAAFSVEIAGLVNGGPLATDHVHDSAGGKNISPALTWSGAPEGTASYVVTCYDPDAPTPSGFWHWALVNLPAATTELLENAGASDDGLPGEAFHVRNDYSQHRYDGASPPPGDRPHRYYFVVHAVGVAALEVDPNTSPAAVSFNLAFHTLARAVIMGTHATPD